MIEKLRIVVVRIPLFARKFVVDAVETGFAALIVLVPIGDRDQLVHSVIAALAGAILAAARRAAPDAIAWCRVQIGAFRRFLGVA